MSPRRRSRAWAKRAARPSRVLVLGLALATAGCGAPPAAVPAVSGGTVAVDPSHPTASTGGIPTVPSPSSASSASPASSAPPASPASLPPAPTGGPPPSPAATPDPRPTPRAPSAVTLRILQTAVDDFRTTTSIPGVSVAIILPDGTAWTGVSGLADVAARRPITPGTAFAAASISKTFVAALTLELSAEGAFGLEDPVHEHLPDLDLDPAITVRMLLDHTSGLQDYFLSPGIDRALQGERSRAWTPERALEYVGRPYFPPGSGWHYSNTNYLLLGMLAEAVTANPIGEELRRRYFVPLGLDATWYQGQEKPRAPLAHGYRLTGEDTRIRPVDLSDGTGIAPFRSVVTASGAAGSVAATALDVASWARALYAGDAIDRDSRALMLASVDLTAGYDPRIPYGLGVQAIEVEGHRTFGHSGRFLGFRGVMRWLPDEEIAIAVLTNQSRVDPGDLAARLVRILVPGPRPVPRSQPF